MQRVSPKWYARPEGKFEREGTPAIFWTNFGKFWGKYVHRKNQCVLKFYRKNLSSETKIQNALNFSILWFVWVIRVKSGMIRKTRGRVWEGGHPWITLHKFLEFLEILENFGLSWKKYVHRKNQWVWKFYRKN